LEVEELFTAFDVIDTFVSAVQEVIELLGGEDTRLCDEYIM
jgi:hypothetical protein